MMILLCKLAIKFEGGRFCNEITTELLSFSIISFLSDILKRNYALHRGHVSNTIHLNRQNFKIKTLKIDVSMLP